MSDRRDDEWPDLPSSEDLIREAREDLAGDHPSDETSLGAPDIDLAADFSRIAEETAPPLPDDLRHARPRYRTTRVDQPAPGEGAFVRPSDRIAGDQQLGGSPYDPVTSGSRTGIVAAVAVVVLIALGALAFVAFVDTSTPASDLSTGDCLLAPEQEEVSTVDIADCAEPHEYEVIGAVTLAGVEYPGIEQLTETARQDCLTLFPGYVGSDYDSSIWYLRVFTPTEESWDAGDREANCIVFQTDDNLEVIQVEGSARGDGR